MTRILYWNIENFGINKIREFTGKRTRAGLPIVDTNAQDRRNLIIKHVTSYNPDIFVVIEVGSGTGDGPGHLITESGGKEGAHGLLTFIKNRTGVPWNLVPPLIVGTQGRAEGVAVYYRSTIAAGGDRFFTGPNRWHGPANGSVRGGISMNYPANFAWLPPLRRIPVGAEHNAGQFENQMAARIDFPAFVAGGRREPYMVSFTETNAAGAITRNLNIFAVHAPPNFPGATQFVADMAGIAELTARLPANEVRVVAGDFNLNLLSNAGASLNSYQLLTNALPGQPALVSLFNPPAPPAPPPPVAPAPDPVRTFKGYFATHMKSVCSAKFWGPNNQLRQFAYPGYDYVGSSDGLGHASIDNILVRRPGALGVMTICNSVTGTPYNLGAAGGPPIGVGIMAHDFLAPPLGLVLPPWPFAQTSQYALGNRQVFRGWRNFGHIRSTSDHMALFATV